MENENTPLQEDDTGKIARLIKAYDLSQKIMSEYYELTGISGLIAQGCLVYLNELSKVDLQMRIKTADKVEDKKEE
jgi:hypothetical protein